MILDFVGDAFPFVSEIRCPKSQGPLSYIYNKVYKERRPCLFDTAFAYLAPLLWRSQSVSSAFSVRFFGVLSPFLRLSQSVSLASSVRSFGALSPFLRLSQSVSLALSVRFFGAPLIGKPSSAGAGEDWFGESRALWDALNLARESYASSHCLRRRSMAAGRTVALSPSQPHSNEMWP